ncbi:hypothetical protein ApAK_06460 [Thermoplasmatales archaeon AK]|nr:hypothetical protein [Thermoplasmatales archaeon AK]
MFTASFGFSFAWFTISFSFPLLAVRLGYPYIVVGFLGFLGSLAFPIVASIYLKAKRMALQLGSTLPNLALAALALVLYFKGYEVFLPVAIAAALVQAFWWISTEISLPLLDTSMGPERYSAGWGIPNAIAPLIAGFIIEYYGFRPLFIISAVIFIVAVFFNPRVVKLDKLSFDGKISVIYALSIFFAGLFSGFIYFVLEPILKLAGISYGEVGILVSIYGIVAAVGYIALNYVHNYSIRSFSIASSILIFPTFFLGFSISLYFLLPVIVLAGLGVSISMTKVLTYLTANTSPRKAIFAYETTFGAGFMAGSLGVSALVQYFGIISLSAVFILPLGYSLLLIIRWIIRAV